MVTGHFARRSCTPCRRRSRVSVAEQSFPAISIGDGRPDIALPIIGANPGLAVLLNSTGTVAVQPALGDVTATPSTVTSGSAQPSCASVFRKVSLLRVALRFTVSSSNTAVLSVPSSVFMTAGSSSVRFIGNARNVTSTQRATVRVRNNQFGRREVTVTVTPGTPTPTPLTFRQ